MGRFNDLPKDVVWIILRQTFHLQRNDFFDPRRWPVVLPLSVKKLECQQFCFDPCLSKTSFDLYTNWMGLFALINKLCLRIIKAKTVKISQKEWAFVKGALTGQ